MFALNILATAALVLSSLPRAVAIPTISTLGNKFFDSNGKQFFVKGMILQFDSSSCVGGWLHTRNRVSISTRRSSYRYRTMPTRCELDGEIGRQRDQSISCWSCRRSFWMYGCFRRCWNLPLCWFGYIYNRHRSCMFLSRLCFVGCAANNQLDKRYLESIPIRRFRCCHGRVP